MGSVIQSFKRLAESLQAYDIMDEDDVLILKRCLYKLGLEVDSLEAVNVQIMQQIHIEADIIYLISKYKRLQHTCQLNVDLEESNALLEVPKKNEDGYKMTVREVKAYLIANPELAQVRCRLGEVTSLIEDLQSVAKVIFKRNDKLDHLSVNLRREIAADSKV